MIPKKLEIDSLNLSPIDRLKLIEKLLVSLSEPNPSVEEYWLKESERRFQEFERGEVKAIPYEEVKKRILK